MWDEADVQTPEAFGEEVAPDAVVGLGAVATRIEDLEAALLAPSTLTGAPFPIMRVVVTCGGTGNFDLEGTLRGADRNETSRCAPPRQFFVARAEPCGALEVAGLRWLAFSM